MNGKNNIAIGFLTMGFFMAYGFFFNLPKRLCSRQRRVGKYLLHW